MFLGRRPTLRVPLELARGLPFPPLPLRQRARVHAKAFRGLSPRESQAPSMPDGPFAPAVRLRIPGDADQRSGLMPIAIPK